jgi:diguanylate cyclase (GGDEF)-like protein
VPGITPDPAFVNPRTLAGVAAIVIAALLLLLYAYRRRNFIVWWVGAWALLASSLLITRHTFVSLAIDRMVYGTSQFLGIVASLTFVVAADAYRHRPHLRREYGLVLLPIALWFALAPGPLDVDAVFAPGHVLIAGGLAAAAVAHLVLLRDARLIGAGVIGIALLTLAGLNLWTAAFVGTPDAPDIVPIMLLTAVVFLVTALGMQLMTFEDMTYELQRTNRRLEAAQNDLRRLAITDPLTGCRNRRFFDEVIGRELQRHARYRTPLSLLFVDVDHFKMINDTLGHEVGDQVLRHVAAFLVRNIREADYVFRWGGDEFLVLMTCTGVQAMARARQLQESFAAASETALLPRGVALSVGTVEVPPDTTDVMPLVQRADERMYTDKKRRRG